MEDRMESVGEYEYNKKDLIGHGAFAVVFRGRKKQAAQQKTDEIVAIKCINKKNLSKSQTLPEKEIEILKDLHHENVVSLLHFKETPTSMFLVMEYCNGGDLADYLHAKGTLSEDTIRFFLRQIAAAMVVLHNKGIIHRDLKPQNLLLSHQAKKTPPPSEIKIKIADFGFARILEEDMMAATLCGSPLYMAPEVIMSQQYDGKADLWSLGTIIFQCLTGSAPFKASNPQELKKFYQRAKLVHPEIPSGTSRDLKDLLIRLLKRNQKDRIEFDVFFNHPFLGKKAQPTSSAPMPVPSRTYSFVAESPERRTLSVSPLSGNMPISSPEDQPPRKHRSSSSQSDNSRGGNVSSSPDKYGAGTPQSISSLDNEIVEGDFVLVSPHFQCFEQSPKNRHLQRRRSISDPPPPSQPPRRSSLPAQSPPPPPHHPVAMYATQAPGGTRSPTNRSQSPNGRPTSLPIAAGSPQDQSKLSPNGKHYPPGIKMTPPTSTPSSQSAISPSKNSPQGALHHLQFGKLPSPVAAAGLVSPGSLPSSGSPGAGVIHRVSGRPQGSPSPPLFRLPGGSSNSPPLPEVGSAAAHKWSPPTIKQHPSTGSPGRRKSSSPARISPLAFTNPSALPTIMGSPTKRSDWVNSPPRTDSAILQGPLSAPFARAQRTKTFCGAIGGLDQEDHSPTFPRSASSSRLDQYSLKAAFESLGKSPAGSIEGLAALATSPPTSAKFYIGSTSRRNSALLSEGSPNSQGSIPYAASPPNMMGPIMFVAPELPEETLLEPEHNEIVDRLTVILGIVDAVIEVAQQRSDPLAESLYGVETDIGTGDQICFVSEGYRRAEQLVLYARGLDVLSAALDMAKTEIQADRLKPSNTVRNVITALNDRYHQCLGRCRSLYSRNVSRAKGLAEKDKSMITAEKLMYNYAVDLCQRTGLEELFGNPQECSSRYHTAQMLLHGLCLQAASDSDRELLLKYKLLLDQRIQHLEKQAAPSIPSLPT